MRLLVVTPFLPHARASHGGGAYLADLLAGMAPLTEIGLVALAPALEKIPTPAPTPWTYELLAEQPPRQRGLRGLPERMRHLWLWRRLPLVAAKHWHAAMPHLLARARREWRPDAVLVELAQMAQYLPFLAGVPTILTDHEAGCPANTTTGLGAWGDDRDRRLWHRYVDRHYRAASALQAVTPEDAATLQAQLGLPVTVRPPVIALPSQQAAPAKAPPRALFLGDYCHAPNPEAARRLVHEVLPLLRGEIADCELWFAGPNSDRIADLQQHTGVRCVGFIPDLPTLFAQVRLLLAPVYSGGGFRMKALTALAHGLPVVTNSLGARGLAAPPAARRVAESPQDLAAAALPWLTSAAAAGEAGEAARVWASSHTSPRAVAEAQLARIRALLPTSQ